MDKNKFLFTSVNLWSLPSRGGDQLLSGDIYSRLSKKVCLPICSRWRLVDHLWTLVLGVESSGMRVSQFRWKKLIHSKYVETKMANSFHNLPCRCDFFFQESVERLWSSRLWRLILNFWCDFQVGVFCKIKDDKMG